MQEHLIQLTGLMKFERHHVAHDALHDLKSCCSLLLLELRVIQRHLSKGKCLMCGLGWTPQKSRAQSTLAYAPLPTLIRSGG